MLSTSGRSCRIEILWVIPLFSPGILTQVKHVVSANWCPSSEKVDYVIKFPKPNVANSQCQPPSCLYWTWQKTLHEKMMILKLHLGKNRTGTFWSHQNIHSGIFLMEFQCSVWTVKLQKNATFYSNIENVNNMNNFDWSKIFFFKL